jgi:hypothetical protein
VVDDHLYSCRDDCVRMDVSAHSVHVEEGYVNRMSTLSKTFFDTCVRSRFPVKIRAVSSNDFHEKREGTYASRLLSMLQGFPFRPRATLSYSPLVLPDVFSLTSKTSVTFIDVASTEIKRSPFLKVARGRKGNP